VDIKRAFRELEVQVPNVGSWTRRLATALDPDFEGRGSWARRAVATLETQEDLGPGSWRTRLKTAIRKGLI
jgi:hypothetical protein